MQGGTEFHFVTGGIHAAYARAAEAACEREIRLGGGVATLRAYLLAGLVDDAHFAMPPVLLGAGEHLFAGLDLPRLGYRCCRQVQGENASHIFVAKRP